MKKYFISTISVEEYLNDFLILISYFKEDDNDNTKYYSVFKLDDGCTFHNLMKHTNYCTLDKFSIGLNGNGEAFFNKISSFDLSKLNGYKLKLKLGTLERPNKLLTFLNTCRMAFLEVIVKKYGPDENGIMKNEFYIYIDPSSNNILFNMNTIKAYEVKMIFNNLCPIIEEHGGYPVSVHLYQFNNKMMNIIMDFINGCIKHFNKIEIIMEEAYDKNHLEVLKNEYLNSSNYTWSLVDYEIFKLSIFSGEKHCSECNKTERIVVEYKKYMTPE
uniref:Uncharacterized protein n=1 Tax=Parastrongyloides trichosuri TaxID=131310 RepID=A0A0N4ZTW9_PARTI